MDDDLNTPEAMSALFDLAREINRCRDRGEAQAANQLGGRLKQLGAVLGLLQSDPDAYLRGAGPDAAGADDDAIEHLVASRVAARAARNWAEADRIRAELTDLGVVLEDTPDGTLWRRE